MKKVAIVGYTPSRELAPFNDPSWEIWGLNDLYRFVPRYDRWFEFHGKHRDGYIHNPKPGRLPWQEVKAQLATMQCPVYLQDVVPEIPNSVKFPLEEILNEFGQYFLDKKYAKYFTNSVSFMLALAIYEKYDEIHVYGVDMATSSEYGHQRPSCEFWLGVAIGRGITIHVPEEADLLKSRFMYGYEEEKKHVFETKIKKMLETIESRKMQSVQKKRAAETEEFQYIGAATALREMMQAWE